VPACRREIGHGLSEYLITAPIHVRKHLRTGLREPEQHISPILGWKDYGVVVLEISRSGLQMSSCQCRTIGTDEYDRVVFRQFTLDGEFHTRSQRLPGLAPEFDRKARCAA
jgi:hypothetical protein